jgi:hypothetical protein
MYIPWAKVGNLPSSTVVVQVAFSSGLPSRTGREWNGSTSARRRVPNNSCAMNLYPPRHSLESRLKHCMLTRSEVQYRSAVIYRRKCA